MIRKNQNSRQNQQAGGSVPAILDALTVGVEVFLNGDHGQVNVGQDALRLEHPQAKWDDDLLSAAGNSWNESENRGRYRAIREAYAIG